MVTVRTLRARVRPDEDVACMRVRVHEARAERHVRKRLRTQHCLRACRQVSSEPHGEDAARAGQACTAG